LLAAFGGKKEEASGCYTSPVSFVSLGKKNIRKKYSKRQKDLRRSGIEPEAKPWKGFMLPLHQRRRR
jgi:hypothetical protein